MSLVFSRHFSDRRCCDLRHLARARAMLATARIHYCECRGAGGNNADYAMTAMKLETINTRDD